jgi:hypothetical protein
MGARPPRVGAGSEHERGGERQQQKHVVVSAADCQHEQHRVEADEDGGEPWRVAQLPGRPREQRHRAKARRYRKRLQRPQPPGEPERHDRITPEREQRAVGRVLEGPSHEPVHRVGGGLGGDVCVGVESVQGAQSGEIEIPEDVLGDQRRAEQQHEVRGDDRQRQGPTGQRARGKQHCHVARGHDQRERLEAVWRDAHAETLKGARHPPRPAAAACRDVLRGPARRARGNQEYAREHAEQAERAKRAQRAHRDRRFAGAGRWAGAGPGSHAGPNSRQRCGCLHALIVTSRKPARLY